MNSLESESISEISWLTIIKKEMIENQKSKETLYNFDFTQDRIRSGNYLWEMIHDPLQVTTSKH